MRIAVTRADAATLLARALRLSAAARDVVVEAITIEDRPWASATFEGVRHRVSLVAGAPGAQRWLAALAEADLPIRGHIVADLAVDAQMAAGDAVAATLIVLTLAES